MLSLRLGCAQHRRLVAKVELVAAAAAVVVVVEAGLVAVAAVLRVAEEVA